MTKKVEPTESYLLSLERDLAAAEDRFGEAKKALYRITATAKLGEPAFENARKACLDAVTEISKVTAEIDRVKRALVK